MRLLLHAVAIVAGVAVSIAAVSTHRSVVLDLPLGLILGLAATFAAVWAMREVLRRLASSFALGWIVAFGFAIVGRPEGDFAVASDLRGYALMAAALGVVAIGVASFPPVHPSSPPGDT